MDLPRNGGSPFLNQCKGSAFLSNYQDFFIKNIYIRGEKQ